MRALSLSQPWASLVVGIAGRPGPKTIENRPVTSSLMAQASALHRSGETFAIHAAKSYDGGTAAEIGRQEFGLPHRPELFDQASQAERLKTALAIAMKLSPNVRDVWVRDGSLLDDDSLDALEIAAAFAGCQIWLERVGEKDEGAIIIRDGRVAGAGAA